MTSPYTQPQGDARVMKRWSELSDDVRAKIIAAAFARLGRTEDNPGALEWYEAIRAHDTDVFLSRIPGEEATEEGAVFKIGKLAAQRLADDIARQVLYAPGGFVHLKITADQFAEIGLRAMDIRKNV